MAQSVKQLSTQLLIAAQIVISQFVRSSPMLGSALTARSLLGILSLPFSLCPSPAHSLSLKINKYTLKKKREREKYNVLNTVGASRISPIQPWPDITILLPIHVTVYVNLRN